MIVPINESGEIIRSARASGIGGRFFPGQFVSAFSRVPAEVVLPRGVVDLLLLFALGNNEEFSEPPLAESIEDFLVFGFLNQFLTGMFYMLFSGEHVLALREHAQFCGRQILPSGEDFAGAGCPLR